MPLSSSSLNHFRDIVASEPESVSYMKGGPYNPSINGKVFFYKTETGTFVAADISGLPESACGIFGFHIHEGGSCTGNETDPFYDTGGHYNPSGSEHPCHAGDMPPLFSNSGHAFMVFLTNRFTAKDIIGHTAVIHSKPDDFITQPSGNSGTKIACGTIYPFNSYYPVS